MTVPFELDSRQGARDGEYVHSEAYRDRVRVRKSRAPGVVIPVFAGMTTAALQNALGDYDVFSVEPLAHSVE